MDNLTAILPYFPYLLLAVGFVFLIKGANFLVDGASAVARRLNISPLIIGLTVVAFGTSTPELLVNIFASAGGQTGIAIGNIIGSNIANILLILGVASAIYPLAVKRDTVWREIPLSLLAIFVLGVLANDAILDGSGQSVLTRIDGLMLLAFFAIFLSYSFSASKTNVPDLRQEHLPSIKKSYLLTLAGLIGLTLGGKMVVDNATDIALALGLSQTLIGLTLVAIGTSLPELVTSAVAAYKRNTDLAIGNIVGSNIFNIFWVLGVSAVIRPLPFAVETNTDIAVAAVASLALFAFLAMGGKHIIRRWQGVSFIIIYVSYLIFLTLASG